MSFQYDEIDTSKNDVVELRTAPFGPPKDRDNEPFNPGRLSYASTQGSSYSTRDPRKFFFIDEMELYTTKEDWQSGPSDNDPMRDHVSEHSGYWTSPGGENCDWDSYSGTGDPHKPTTFSMTIVGRAKRNMIYNIGHGAWMSTAEGVDYGVVGISGHIGATYDNNYLNDGIQSFASVGIQHIYCMYRADTTKEEVEVMTEKLADLEIWFLEIADHIDEVFPNGVPDNLEELIQNELDSNNTVFDVDGDGVDDNESAATVGSYTHRSVSLLFNQERLSKLRNIVLKKDAQTIKVLEMLQEIMARQFNNCGGIDTSTYNPDVNLDYILSLFDEPAAFNFEKEGGYENLYGENDLLITGIEIMMWVFHSYFGECGNVDLILEALSMASGSSNGNKIAKDYETEFVNAYWTGFYKDEPSWDAYSLVTYYDGFYLNGKYVMKNNNTYPVSLWWSDPLSQQDNLPSIFGGIVDPDDMIEVVALGYILKIGAISPGVSNEHWNKITGVLSDFIVADAIDHYASTIPGYEGIGNNPDDALSYTGYGYWQSQRGTIPSWAVTDKGGRAEGAGGGYDGAVEGRTPYHDTWMDPIVQNGTNADTFETNEGHNTVCTWSLQVPSTETQATALAYYPKRSVYKEIEIWGNKYNYNMLNASPNPAQSPWKSKKRMKPGSLHKFIIEKNSRNDWPERKNPVNPMMFYRVGVPPKPNGRHYASSPAVGTNMLDRPADVIEKRGFPLQLMFNVKGSDAGTPVQQFQRDCNTKNGVVELNKVIQNADGTKTVTFDCVDNTGKLITDPIEFIDGGPGTAAPIPPHKKTERPRGAPTEPNPINGPTPILPPAPGTKLWRWIPEVGEWEYWLPNDPANLYGPGDYVRINEPKAYRYETITQVRRTPMILESDQPGDFCVMRKPGRFRFPGRDEITNPPPNEVGREIAFLYIFTGAGQWDQVDGINEIDSISNANEIDTDKLTIINNNTNMRFPNYFGPEPHIEEDLHKTDNPNFMIYMKNSKGSYKSNGFVWTLYPKGAPLGYDGIDIVPDAVPLISPPLGGPRLVHLEKDFPNVPNVTDYKVFEKHSELWGWNPFTNIWVDFTPGKGKSSYLTVRTFHPDQEDEPKTYGRMWYNSYTLDLYISWWNTIGTTPGTGTFKWMWLGKIDTLQTDNDPPHIEYNENQEILKLYFRFFGDSETPQVFCSNTNGDPDRFPVLVMGTVPAPVTDFTSRWEYIPDRGSTANTQTNTIAYYYLEKPSPGKQTRVIRVTNTNGVQKSENVFFQNTRAKTKFETFRLRNFVGPKYTPTNTEYSVDGDGKYDRIFVDNTLTLESYLPELVSVFVDGVAPSTAGLNWGGNRHDAEGFSHETFYGEQMNVTGNPEDLIDANSLTPMPKANVPGVNNDLNPFLIYRNPVNRSGSGPVWKYFPIYGWREIVPGEIRTSSTNLIVTFGDTFGKYERGNEPPSGWGIRPPALGPGGVAAGTDVFDYKNGTWGKIEKPNILRFTGTAPDPLGYTPGTIAVVTEERIDYNVSRAPNGEVGTGGSTDKNYDNSTVYVLTINENGVKEWRIGGSVPDTTNRINVENLPEGLSSGNCFIRNEIMYAISNKNGTKYTLVEVGPVEPTNEADISQKRGPKTKIINKTRPTDPPGPHDPGSKYNNGPYNTVSTQTEWPDGSLDPGDPTDPNSAITLKKLDRMIRKIITDNSYLWIGKPRIDQEHPSTEVGEHVPITGIPVVVGPNAPPPDPTQGERETLFKINNKSSKTGQIWHRINDRWEIAGPGTDLYADLKILRPGDPEIKKKGKQGDQRYREMLDDDDYAPGEVKDGSKYRLIAETYDEKTNSWIPYILSPMLERDIEGEPVSEFLNCNTRLYYGNDLERPNWRGYNKVYSWKFTPGEKLRFVYGIKGPDINYPRHPSDHVCLWWSATGTLDPEQWTRDGTLRPDEKLEKTVVSNKTYCRLAVKSQKAPNAPPTTEERWPKDGAIYPVCVGKSIHDNFFEELKVGPLPGGNVGTKTFNDSTGIITYTETNPVTGATVRQTTHGGWISQIHTKSQGEIPIQTDPPEDQGTQTPPGPGGVDQGTQAYQYGPPVIKKPENADHIKEGTTFPKKAKKGDLFFKKPENRLYTYIDSVKGWKEVATVHCPNTKTPPEDPDVGDMYYHPSRKVTYVWNGKKWQLASAYRPTTNPDVDDKPSGGGNIESNQNVNINAEDAAGIISSLASCSKYAAIVGGVLLGAKAVGAKWLQEKETDFLAECKVFEPGHELAIGFGSNDVDRFCTWPDLNHKFINMTISEETRVLTQLLRCRFNGYMFHLTCASGSGQEVRQMKIHSVVPTYSWGLFEMYNTGALRVMREYPQNATNSHPKEGPQWGVQVEGSFKLDTRTRLIDNQGVMTTVPSTDEDGNTVYDSDGQIVYTDRPWNHEDAWFKPQTSVCLRTVGQGDVYTKAREKYHIGDLGLEWIKAEGTTSGHPEVSGINKHRIGPGLYVMNIFNDIGAGSKYYEHYNTTNSSHAWVWEVLAHEPKQWPLTFSENNMQVGLELDLGSIKINKDQPRAARDWQINFMHLSFETSDGKMKSIKLHPQSGHDFRDSEAYSNVPTHKMGQLENDQYRKVIVWSEDTVQFDDLFWGFAVNAWIGTEYAGDRWRNYNIKNLKPLIRISQ